MIVVRDIFQVKFGQAREAIAIWKEGISIGERQGMKENQWHLLTDFVGGPYYTLIAEATFNSLGEFEQKSQAMMSDKEWKAWYKKLVPLVDSGRREILKGVE